MGILNISKNKHENSNVPTTVEEAIPIYEVFEDGIFLVGKNKWSKPIL